MKKINYSTTPCIILICWIVLFILNGSQALAKQSATAHSATTPHMAATEAEQLSKETEFWPIFGHRVKITDTLLVIFTGILCLATFGLWRATYDLVKDSQKNSQLTLRAYIGITNWSLNREDNTFIIHIRNAGQTYAHDLHAHLNTQWYAVPNVMPSDFSFPDYGTENSERSSLFLNSGQELPIAFNIDGSLFPRLLNGEINFYVYGFIRYKDIFGNQQRVNFCYESRYISEERGQLRISDRHNNAT